MSSVRERTFPLGPPNEDGMRNPDKRRWREVGERREGGGGERGPLWTYQTAQECSGKNELGSLAQDGPCDWV